MMIVCHKIIIVIYVSSYKFVNSENSIGLNSGLTFCHTLNSLTFKNKGQVLVSQQIRNVSKVR